MSDPSPREWGAKLRARFPDLEQRAEHWADIKTRVAPGDELEGEVVARAAFGVWVDIGLGVPALLEVIEFVDADTRRYSFEDYPAEGSRVRARVTQFRDEGFQIYLSQRTRRFGSPAK